MTAILVHKDYDTGKVQTGRYKELMQKCKYNGRNKIQLRSGNEFELGPVPSFSFAGVIKFVETQLT